jgi:hypothetical protein
MSCALAESLGLYVLDALDDDERAAVDTHVADCAECRRERERLLPLTHYLDCLTTAEALHLDTAAPPPVGLLTRLRAAVSVEHRRLVRIRIAAAAIALVLAVVVAGDASRPAPAPVLRAAATDARSGVSARIAVAPQRSGSLLTVSMRGAAAGERCRLLARSRDGRTDVAATWRATYRGAAAVTGSAAIPPADLASVDVVTTGGRRLVRVTLPTPQESHS